jgi:hypothetical protein
MTLDEAEMDLSKCFVPGQGYVALSRVRSLEGLYVRGFNSVALEVDSRVAATDASFQKRSDLARERLALLSHEDLKKKQETFISTCGGSLKPIQKHKEPQQHAKRNTVEETRKLLNRGMILEEVAAARGLVVSTIMGHAEKLLEQGVRFDFSYLAPDRELLSVLQEAVGKHGFARLTPLMRYLESRGYELSFDDLRKARLALWPKSS